MPANQASGQNPAIFREFGDQHIQAMAAATHWMRKSDNPQSVTLFVECLDVPVRRSSGSPAGAEASAMLYSLVETDKANGLEPRAYLHYLFETLPHARQPENIEALLPHNLTPEMLKIPKPAL